jgi:predicted AAA+ superfamily ATPase
MIGRLLLKQISHDKKSLLLLGPRQVGKSTLLHSLKPDLVVDLSSEEEFFHHSSDPSYLSSLIQNNKLILIDEIQRVPSLLNAIQYEIDKAKRESRSCRFLISGSSARKLKRGQANLLPGRLFSYELSGLCAKELQYKVDINKAMCLGFLPEPYLETNIKSAQKMLTSYSAIYLKEEIQAESLTRNIQGFARFLNIIAQRASEIIDFSKLATKSKVSRTTTVRFVELLEDTLVAQRVYSFEEAPEADVVKHPKIYFFDVGVLNGLLQNFIASPDRIGALFEHLVYNQVRNSVLAHDIKAEIFYFRTRHGVEVDFIVKLNKKVWAIEVKAGKVDSGDLSALKIFREYFPDVHKCVVVSPSEKKRSLEDILVCALPDLLLEMGL